MRKKFKGNQKFFGRGGFPLAWNDPNMEIINKKYLIKTENSKMIIFIGGSILSFSTNKG